MDSTDEDLQLLSRDDDINRASNALKAMAHPIRLKILCTLGEEELSVLEIVSHVGTSQSNISQHLDILRDKAIITSHREGNKILCKVKNLQILGLISKMRDVFCTTP
jgi:ArsR family transcriptional regulator